MRFSRCACLRLQPCFGQGVFLNEVDSDSNTVPDSTEFVELYGAPNTPLDGHIVVFYKGGGSPVTSSVYAAFDLDGMSTDSAGFFLLANPEVAGADVVFEPGLLRDGGDAVALFEGDSMDFPFATPLTTVGLLDAVVYGTGDQTNPFLIDSLNPWPTSIGRVVVRVSERRGPGLGAFARWRPGFWLGSNGPPAAHSRVHQPLGL